MTSDDTSSSTSTSTSTSFLQSIQPIALNSPEVLGGTSSGFAFPSSSPFEDSRLHTPATVLFASSGSPSSTLESTPLRFSETELWKLSLGIERYARAIQDPDLLGSFSGTVPLPSLIHQQQQQQHQEQQRLQEMTIIPGGDTSMNDSKTNDIRDRDEDAIATGIQPGGNGSSDKSRLASIKRAFTVRRNYKLDQDKRAARDNDDLEANLKYVEQEKENFNPTSKHDEISPEDYHDEKKRQENITTHLEEDYYNGVDQSGQEGLHRRFNKSKGGVLSHLLKLQRNETEAAVAAAASAVAVPANATSSTPMSNEYRSSVRRLMPKKTKKGLYYRSRNNSDTHCKSISKSASPSITTTPKVSPRNSFAFDETKKTLHSCHCHHFHHESSNDNDHDPHLHSSKERSKKHYIKDLDNRIIHRDIADILSRQSFLIMMAKSLILYGAPSHRIEETCVLLARKMSVDASFALLPGSMTVSFSDPETHTSDTRHLKCNQGMDMNKLAEVHRIALAVLKDHMPIEKANRDLEQLTSEPGMYPLWLTLLGWMGSSAFVAPLAFNGGGWDMLLAGCCGLMVGMLAVVASKFPVYGNVFEMTSSILVGFVAKAFGDRVCFSAVALAGIVVLLPGLVLTQAIMELSSRNIVSGAVRMFYALMYAFFLGFGLSIGAELWDYISHGSIKTTVSVCQNPIDRWWYFLIYPAVSASINIVFNAHPRQWLGMTLVTAVGFVVTLFLKSSGPQITAAIAAFCVGITGKLYGRLTGQLSYVPLLSGVLLLVPGSVGVRGILAIIGSDPSQGFVFVLTMIHVSVAITLGVFCSALVWYPFWRRSTFMNF